MEISLELIGSSLLALGLGFILPTLELATGHYHQTYFLLLRDKNRALIQYGLMYGFIAFVLSILASYGTVKLDGIGLTNPWGRAVALGLTTKAFLHINILSVPRGSKTAPVGFEYLIQFMEKPLLYTILLDEFNLVRQYIDPHAAKYSDLDQVKRKIKNNVPPSLPEDERTAIKVDIDSSKNVTEAMETYLRYLGQGSFERVFPL